MILCLDTSTDQLSIALGEAVVTASGGARASSLLLPHIQTLMAKAGCDYADLTAIAFGRGPGAFTGLRTAASVVQGLAYAHSTPVLAVDTLLMMAYLAHVETGQTRILAVLDARMGQAYHAYYDFSHMAAPWQVAAALCDSAAIPVMDGALWVGNIDPPHRRGEYLAAVPHARSLQRLAPHLLQAGMACTAAQALPVYVRDKVADTTAERERAKHVKDAQRATIHHT